MGTYLNYMGLKQKNTYLHIIYIYTYVYIIYNIYIYTMSYTRSYVILCHSDILGHSEDFSLSAPATALDAARYLYVSAVSYRYAEVESRKNWSQEMPSQYITWYHVILSSIISQFNSNVVERPSADFDFCSHMFSGLYQIKTHCGPMSTLASFL